MNRTRRDHEYVLGTSDAEIDRLRLQHALWRADAAAAWQAAEFCPGDTILDIGCGPGFASLDLADVVGPDGRVLAVDQSKRFLDHLAAQSVARAVTNITTIREDLASFDFAGVRADGAWLRWVLAFVPNPHRALQGVVGALKPGAHIAIHEYIAYEMWKLVPGNADFDGFVAAVMASWRSRGGEPNVGLELPLWLEGMGLEIRATRVIANVVTRDHPRWHWPIAFAVSGLERLVELGDMTERAAARVRARLLALDTDHTWMITPAVLEVIARKPNTALRSE